MRATIRPVLLVTTILLILGVSAPAAYASDRHRHGDRDRHHKRHEFSRHTQGRSMSDPDGMSNRGFDKPGFAGGFSEDRDWNNGCGNDDDREDDNNGNCGMRRQAVEHDEDAVKEHEEVEVRFEFKDIDDDEVGEFEELRKEILVPLAFKAALKSAFLSAFKASLTMQAASVGMIVVNVPAVTLAALVPVTLSAVTPPSTLATVAPAPPEETEVLGVQLEQQPAPELAPEVKSAGAIESRSRLGLVRTGLAILGAALVGFGLVTLGRLARGVRAV